MGQGLVTVSKWFRRHYLPAPTFALWPTEVHFVVRRKLRKKGVMLGVPPPLVPICRMKARMSNVCHYLNFQLHTAAQGDQRRRPPRASEVIIWHGPANIYSRWGSH